MPQSFRHALRAGAFIITFLYVGAAFAEQKQSSDDAKANCASIAAAHLGIEQGQCLHIPNDSPSYAICMTNAVTKYTDALRACDEGSGSASLTTLGGDGGGKPGKRDHGQFGKPAGGLTAGDGGSTKAARLTFGKLGGLNAFGG